VAEEMSFQSASKFLATEGEGDPELTPAAARLTREDLAALAMGDVTRPNISSLTIEDISSLVGATGRWLAAEPGVGDGGFACCCSCSEARNGGTR